ncbi:hypothetical protein ACODYM_28740 [Burkholderia gladioli]|uniref:hypothetical protein n=1 Tax=Burkholderia gladioli TaxID=28095 RepID=UPI003B50C606
MKTAFLRAANWPLWQKMLAGSIAFLWIWALFSALGIPSPLRVAAFGTAVILLVASALSSGNQGRGAL